MCSSRLAERLNIGLQWRLRAVRGWLISFLRERQKSARLWPKWWQDKRKLPLTAEHWPLYRTIHHHYRVQMGYWPELVNCRDFNHKIQWLKLFDQDESMVKCSDKLLVRDYVSERVGSKYLTALYQVGSQYQDIDFDRLPKSFVLKTNHDSGSVVLVRDKSILDHCATARLLNASLNRVYGSEKGEWAYALIAPKLFVEEFIDPGENMPPPDFKFHCVDGKVRYLHYIYDRGGDTRELFTDRQCRLHAFNVYFPYGDQRVFSKPIEWDEMVEIAEKLSGPFKYVRVDMFLSSGRIYVGEMTFWPMAGCYHEEGQGVLGRALDFDRHNAKPPVYLALS